MSVELSLFDALEVLSEPAPPVAAPQVRPPIPERLPPSGVLWNGAEILRPFLVPLASLDVNSATIPTDLALIREALSTRGQARPALCGPDGCRIVERAYLALAARELGWTHLAVRSQIADELDDADQMTFLDAAPASLAEDLSSAFAATRSGEAEGSVDAINEASRNPDHEWVGLPEFVPVDDAVKLVLSCDTEEDRDALLDILGIATIHKGTRGTLSVWWPDRARKDLASLRFVVRDSR